MREEKQYIDISMEGTSFIVDYDTVISWNRPW